ncbi:MAG: hypothetical protein AB7S50_08205 [Bacteroidales bacterium]
METIDLKILYDALKKTAPKAPLTYLSESTLLFRGEKLEITENIIKSRHFIFDYNSIESFIEGLREFGLMLNYREFENVIKIYRNGNGNNTKNGK